MDALVTLVECAYCNVAQPIVKAIQVCMGSRLRLVFRHFPMRTMRPHAESAAEAAEAAGAQGAFWAMHEIFWAMHEILCRNQRRLSEFDLLGDAKALGLDVGQFGRSLIQHLHARKVREDFLSGVMSDVSGTPTFYINGVRHDGSWDLAVLLAAIHRAAEANK